MPNHEAKLVELVVNPSWHDIVTASEVIVEQIRKAGYCTTGSLFAPVAQRLAQEPVPDDATRIEGVTEADLRRVRADAATMTALAHLDAAGAILPMGPHHYYHHGKWSVPYSSRGVQSGYSVDGRFNFGVADGYRLPIDEERSPLIDSPGVFIHYTPASMGAKVKRVLLEAVNAYRGTLYLSTAVLLGVASEAAWDQLAAVVQKATGDKKLRDALDDPYMSAAGLQRSVVAELKKLGVKDRELAPMETTAQTYRDLRNYASHHPEETFDPTRIARPVVGVLLAASVDYFRRLYDLHDRVVSGTI